MGDDFAAAVSGSVRVLGNGAYTLNLNAIGLADLDSMRTNGADNAGWVLLSQSEGTGKTARRVAARENSSNAPVLRITYALPAPSEITMLDQQYDQESDEVVLTISSEAGARYVLERADSPVSTSWLALGQATAGLSGALEMRGSTVSLKTAFFRITKLPEVP